MVKVTLQIFFSGRVMCYESRLASIPIHARYVVIFTSILLKNSSFHLHRHRLSWSESGCKDKAFSRFPPNLSRSFFKLFFSSPRLKGPSTGKIVVSTSRTPPPRELAVPSSRPPFRFSGCKDKAKIPPFPNFSTTFLATFLISTGIQHVARNVSRPRGAPRGGRLRVYHPSTRRQGHDASLTPGNIELGSARNRKFSWKKVFPKYSSATFLLPKDSAMY